MNNALLRFAVGQGSGACHQRAVAHGISKLVADRCARKNFRSAHGRLCFAPVRRIRGNYGKARETEIRHGPRRRTYVEGVTRRHEHHFNLSELALFALDVDEQVLIVERWGVL